MILILNRSTRIDWPRMAENLRRAGMSMQQIADAIEVSRSSLDNWAQPEASGEPAYWTGAAMIVLWCRRTGLSWPDLPTRRVAPSAAEVLRTSS